MANPGRRGAETALSTNFDARQGGGRVPWLRRRPEDLAKARQTSENMASVQPQSYNTNQHPPPSTTGCREPEQNLCSQGHRQEPLTDSLLPRYPLSRRSHRSSRRLVVDELDAKHHISRTVANPCQPSNQSLDVEASNRNQLNSMNLLPKTSTQTKNEPEEMAPPTSENNLLRYKKEHLLAVKLATWIPLKVQMTERSEEQPNCLQNSLVDLYPTSARQCPPVLSTGAQQRQKVTLGSAYDIEFNQRAWETIRNVSRAEETPQSEEARGRLYDGLAAWQLHYELKSATEGVHIA